MPPMQQLDPQAHGHTCRAMVPQGYSAAAGGAGSLSVGLHQHAAQQGHTPALLAVGDAFWCLLCRSHCCLHPAARQSADMIKQDWRTGCFVA